VRNIYLKPAALCVVAWAALGVPSSAQAEDLLESYQLALSADADFQAAKAAAAAGAEVVPQARAQILPNVTVSAGFFDNKLDTETTLSKRYDEYPSKSASLSLRQPLFRPAAYAGLREAAAQGRGVRAAFGKAESDLILRVVEAYFSVALAKDQLNSLYTQKALAFAQVQAAKVAMRFGQGTRTDADDAQARHDLIAARVLAGRQQLEELTGALRAIVNEDIRDVKGLDPSKIQLEPVDNLTLEDWVATANARNPDLIALNAQVSAAKWNVRRVASSFLPTVDLIMQKSLTQSDNVVNPNAKYTNSQIGVQLSMPLYTGGYNYSKLRQSRSSLSEVEARYDGAKRKLELQVEREFNAVEQSIERIRALELAARSADQALISNQKGYQAGTRSQLDVLDAEEKKANVYLDLSRARIEYVLARMRLLAISDQLDVSEIERVNRWLSE